MNAMDVCFNSLSSITGFNYGQYNFQRDCWNFWTKIEASNSNVSTGRGNGSNNLEYYVFPTMADKNKFDTGLSLHVQYLGGYITITPVQKN